ncbi:1-phosphatidylinositol 4,5-bisphosphate phosphodiesterase delta-3-like isoform X1 [Hypanus sabinus]|uniref:1-phosphatidylinositol 4,5-bisphosphate phosphodiesterase delta-3-like isoform X1 n=1 Tax=Hypanus sabinus TaxID=79690 RepID=UPI0028C3CAC0|nr:1-phosphatidylinositol 4,5-bisphosphate phosphodiesterase delta-3-like isoform X1 [Hypanus sabinus]
MKGKWKEQSFGPSRNTEDCEVNEVSIDDIKELKAGHQTEGMQRYARDIPTDQCFSIIFKGSRKKLDLVATNADEATHWIRGISKLMERNNLLKRRQWLLKHLSSHVPQHRARGRAPGRAPSPPLPHVGGQRHIPILQYFSVCFPYVTFSSLRPSASTDSISY